MALDLWRAARQNGEPLPLSCAWEIGLQERGGARQGPHPVSCVAARYGRSKTQSHTPCRYRGIAPDTFGALKHGEEMMATI